MAADIDSYLARLTADGQFSGAVLVVFEGNIVVERGYGWADHAQGSPNLPTTKFRIASLTKAFTALAVLLLQEQGRLAVDDPICRYLPSCPGAWQPVTIHHLLTHTSGIPDYTASPGFWEDLSPRAVSSEEVLALVSDQPLVSVPGERFTYSNSGYLLLGVIIARVAEPSAPVAQAYATFLQQAIFGPLQMRDTGSEACGGSAAGIATGYAAADTPAMHCDPSSFLAMGDLYSTVHDLYRWGQALEQEGLVPPELQALLFEPYAATSAYQTAYCYGWYLTQLAGVRQIWHAGAAPGYRSYMMRQLGAETMVIILSNYEVAPVTAMGRELNAVMLRHAQADRSTGALYRFGWSLGSGNTDDTLAERLLLVHESAVVYSTDLAIIEGATRTRAAQIARDSLGPARAGTLRRAGANMPDPVTSTAGYTSPSAPYRRTFWRTLVATSLPTNCLFLRPARRHTHRC